MIERSQKILALDKNFDFNSFIVGAKEAFKIIVEAFNNTKVEEIKHLVSKEVYDNFKEAIDVKNNKTKSFNIISVKASILDIKVVKNLANIKVKFLSKQREILDNTTKDLENVEELVRLRKNTVTVRPIAGTRPRGVNKIQDKKFELTISMFSAMVRRRYDEGMTKV